MVNKCILTPIRSQHNFKNANKYSRPDWDLNTLFTERRDQVFNTPAS